MEKPIKSVFVVAFSEVGEKVLLVKAGKKSGHVTGIYGLPAGRLNSDESYKEAAFREFKEETGLETNLKYLIKLPTFYKAELERRDDKKLFVAWSYLCTKYWGRLKESEEGEPVWMPVDGIEKLHLQVNVDKVIKEAERYHKNGQ